MSERKANIIYVHENWLNYWNRAFYEIFARYNIIKTSFSEKFVQSWTWESWLQQTKYGLAEYVCRSIFIFIESKLSQHYILTKNINVKSRKEIVFLNSFTFKAIKREFRIRPKMFDILECMRVMLHKAAHKLYICSICSSYSCFVGIRIN